MNSEIHLLQTRVYVVYKLYTRVDTKKRAIVIEILINYTLPRIYKKITEAVLIIDFEYSH